MEKEKEIEQKTLKIRYATLISIIGGTVSICIFVSSLILYIEKQYAHQEDKIENIIEAMKEIKQDLKSLRK